MVRGDAVVVAALGLRGDGELRQLRAVAALAQAEAEDRRVRGFEAGGDRPVLRIVGDGDARGQLVLAIGEEHDPLLGPVVGLEQVCLVVGDRLERVENRGAAGHRGEERHRPGREPIEGECRVELLGHGAGGADLLGPRFLLAELPAECLEDVTPFAGRVFAADRDVAAGIDRPGEDDALLAEDDQGHTVARVSDVDGHLDSDPAEPVGIVGRRARQPVRRHAQGNIDGEYQVLRLPGDTRLPESDRRERRDERQGGQHSRETGTERPRHRRISRPEQRASSIRQAFDPGEVVHIEVDVNELTRQLYQR